MNTILNPDRTLKNVVAVDEATARSPECPIDIIPEDIFIENAPSVPDGLNTPQLSVDGTIWTEANQAGQDADNQAKAFKEIEGAVDAHILKTASDKGYNSTESCLSYEGDINATWNAEAIAFKEWRSQCWSYVIAEQAKVIAETRTIPTPEEAVAELPVMIWP